MSTRSGSFMSYLIGGAIGGAIGIPLIAFVLVYGLATNFLVGELFDMIMGTHLVSIIMLGGLVGLYGLHNKQADSEGFWSSVGFAFKAMLSAAFFSLVVAYLFQRYVPAMVEDFMQRIGYSGNLYVLAFWGNLLMLGMRLITALPWYALGSFTTKLKKQNKKNEFYRQHDPLARRFTSTSM